MTKKSPGSNHHETKSEDTNLENKIVENLIELQKVHTNLAEKFDKLAKEISNLLALFELTAKNISRNIPSQTGGVKDEEFLEKINKLLEQNKTIAKGLTLMEEKVREKMYAPSPQSQAKREEHVNFPPQGRPLPRF